MGENICWGPTKMCIRSATFHLLISSKSDLTNYADESDKRISAIINGFTITSWFLTHKNAH